ncbi:hypothetical protein [Kurthia massiliensis]|uniref:hypothetical protein n=1 Tax=Kurthia massiliensis TaxID=1033739 RepID=UPI000287B093|nr:hypothetical protein [Kurthia massiliensis]
MGFWHKQKRLQQKAEQQAPREGSTIAIELDHRFIDIRIDRPYIDVIETIHFYNELLDGKSGDVMVRNAKAIEFFAQFTKVPLGNAYDFFQTIVFFYYKHYEDESCPFKGSELTFIFSRVAIDVYHHIQSDIADVHMRIADIEARHPRAFYFHEGNVELDGIRFIRETKQLMPTLLAIDQHQLTTLNNLLLAQEMQEISQDIQGDVARFLDQYAYIAHDQFDQIYQLLAHNNTIVDEETAIDIMGMKYIYIANVDIQRAMEAIRTYHLQRAIEEGLRNYVSLYEGATPTVLGIIEFMNAENDMLYEDHEPTIHANNKRFLNLFFDDYCLKHHIEEGNDSPKVRQFLHALATQYTQEKKKQDGGMMKCTKIIKNAFTKHQLMGQEN